jgi:RecA/RadA recombinase
MNAVAKKEIEAHVVDRLGHVFDRHEKQPVEILTSGVSEIDQALAGFPRGAISEIHGPASCGRTSLMLATLARATSSEETCALIDCSDTFDLSSACEAGVIFDRLLWVRCKSNIEHAFKAVDLLLHGGGFGLVILNLADMPAGTLRRLVSTWGF